MRLSPFALLLLAVAAGPVPADDAADHIERAKLLRKMFEDAPPASAGGSGPHAELPAAKPEIQQQAARERLQVERFQDGQWRQLLESQRASAHRQEPAPQSARSAQAFERGQRARDLSIQIQRQDLQYRHNNRR